jgi:osmotically inducible lipoprotein OsmB
MKNVMIMSTLILALVLSGCTSSQRRDAGIAGGAVVGGLAGHALTGGSAAGTVVGAAVGGVAGNELSK